MNVWTKKEKIFFVLIATCIAILDQWFKYIVTFELFEGQSIEVIPGLFNLVLAYNKGVAFGVFSHINSDFYRFIILSLTTLLALGAVYFFLISDLAKNTIGRIALSLIVGGAIGNLVDRIRLGYVVDYLDFFWGTYHWPAFNLADSSICVAVALLVLSPQKKQPAI